MTDNKTKITAPPPPIVYPPYHTVRRYSGTSQVALSPDGRTLAVASRKDGPAVVCEVPVDGGELRRAFDIEGASVHGLSWSQSGELYCTAHRGGTEQWQVYVRRKDGRVEDFAVSEGDRVQHHLSRGAASPDGQRVAIGTNAREPADVDIAIVDARSKAQRLAVSGPAWHVAGSWSPDGRWLAVMRVTQNTDQDLLAVEDESGEVIEVTTHQGEMQNVPAGWLADGRMLAITDHGSEFLHLEALDLHSGSRELFDKPDADVEIAAASSDGRGVVWSVNEDGYSRLRWRFAGGPTGERVTDGQVGDVVVAADGSRAAYTLFPLAGPEEIRILDLASGEDRVLVTGEPLAQYGPRPESLRIPGTEGDIPCYVYRPERRAARVPALLVIHGGPEGQSRPSMDDPILLELLAKGVAIVVPNIHGSTGYGKSWQTRIHRDWGGVDLADLRSVAQWMQTNRELDPDRLAVFGGSYGGFATLTCVTRLPEFWCCGVDVVGPVNLVTMLENDPPNWRRWNKLWIGDLDTDREKLIQRSPITYVENVRCPMLVIQGDNDPRVPREESDQLVDRLRTLGRPVEYLTLGDEGHGFVRRDSQQIVYERITRFLDEHLVPRTS
ncbi:MAG: S9 family peptidase [Chloroflexi bacterium]|nr:MAG: S9 family peptidase [Chloroflexota bacterium]